MKIQHLFLLGLVMIAISGCIQLTVYQKINRDGTALETIEMNLSKMYEMQKVFNRSLTKEEFDNNMEENLCKKYEENEEYRDVKCAVRDGVIIVEFNESLDNSTFRKEEDLFSTYYIYELDLEALRGKLESGLKREMGDSRSSLYDNVSMLATLKSMGFKMDFIVEMPGEIVETNGEKIASNKVRFDVLDDSVLNEGRMFVKSKEYKVTVFIVLLVILGIVVISFMFMKKKK